MEVKRRWLQGCGHKGEVDYRKGMGKLSWKGEFAVRWKALDIRFEAFGKDVADSVRVNDRICREILDWEPPVHAQYELFLAQGGGKIAKSTGAVLTPQAWFKYGSPQSLMLLLLKRFVGTRAIDVTDIPSYMDEMDGLEDVYFRKKATKDKREQEKLSGLYEYCYAMRVPAKPGLHVPYNLLTYLVKVAPKGGDEAARKRIEHAFNWAKDFERIKEATVALSGEDKMAITKLVGVLTVEDEPDKIQNAIFNAAKQCNLQPAKLFKTIYMILLGVPQGPRLGPYIMAMGKQNVIDALNRALKSQ
jgi:lysyl-tRNA synthetase class 1